MTLSALRIHRTAAFIRSATAGSKTSSSSSSSTSTSTSTSTSASTIASTSASTSTRTQTVVGRRNYSAMTRRSIRRPPSRDSGLAFWMTTAGLAMVTSGSPHNNNNGIGVSLAYCQGDTDDGIVTSPPFDHTALTFDHYNGVTLNLDKIALDGTEFKQELTNALTFWKAEGRKGIWIQAPHSKAHLIPHCVALGFTFHFVKEELLVLSQWLPTDGPSRLPIGPTHQIGIGAVVLNPTDPSQMLVVQEKSGPAAAYQLWKMPTGLLDPGEDVPDAAARELLEETGLEATLQGIICFRQAHSPSRSSDLFFVCRMHLKDAAQPWKLQEEEIAAIQWMSVDDYCNQQRWQGSPVYEALNDSIRKVSHLAVAKQQEGDEDHGGKDGVILHDRLPLGFAEGTNSLFRSQL